MCLHYTSLIFSNTARQPDKSYMIDHVVYFGISFLWKLIFRAPFWPYFLIVPSSFRSALIRVKSIGKRQENKDFFGRQIPRFTEWRKEGFLPRYIALFVFSGSIKTLFLIDRVNIYVEISFEPSFKLRWCCARDLLGSQIPVTTGGFEMQTSCIRSSYLTHHANT